MQEYKARYIAMAVRRAAQTLIPLAFLVVTNIEPAASDTVDEAAERICSGQQVADIKSSTGSITYKDLEVEITNGGKELNLTYKGALLAKIEDFTYDKYQVCVQKMIRTLREKSQEKELDLGWLYLDSSREFIEARTGAAKSITRKDIYDHETKEFKYKTKEYYYLFENNIVRVIYDKDLESAKSIFIGLYGDADQVSITGPGEWDIEWPENAKIKWKKLKFKNFGTENCEQILHNSMSAALNAINCPFTYSKIGGSHYDKENCTLSAGYSDGAFGVYLTDPSPTVTEYDLERNNITYDDMYENSDKYRKFVWKGVKESGVNYFMISCDVDLIFDSW